MSDYKGHQIIEGFTALSIIMTESLLIHRIMNPPHMLENIGQSGSRQLVAICYHFEDTNLVDPYLPKSLVIVKFSKHTDQLSQPNARNRVFIVPPNTGDTTSPIVNYTKTTITFYARSKEQEDYIPDEQEHIIKSDNYNIK